jgi:hypothetical protein
LPSTRTSARDTRWITARTGLLWHVARDVSTLLAR